MSAVCGMIGILKLRSSKMPFVPTPVVGAVSAIHNVRALQGQGEPQDVEKVDVKLPDKRRSAFKMLFFGPGR